YALQAVFSGVDKAERPYDADPRTATRRRQLLRERDRIKALRNSTDPSFLTLAVAEEGAAWEKQLAEPTVKGAPLVPVQCTSAGGATLIKLPDLSVLAGGKRPDVDTYTIVADTNLQGITGIQLEVLTDSSLPHNGPGRQDNGNLHLNEFGAKIAPKSSP